MAFLKPLIGETVTVTFEHSKYGTVEFKYAINDLNGNIMHWFSVDTRMFYSRGFTEVKKIVSSIFEKHKDASIKKN